LRLIFFSGTTLRPQMSDLICCSGLCFLCTLVWVGRVLGLIGSMASAVRLWARIGSCNLRTMVRVCLFCFPFVSDDSVSPWFYCTGLVELDRQAQLEAHKKDAFLKLTPNSEIMLPAAFHSRTAIVFRTIYFDSINKLRINCSFLVGPRISFSR